MGIALHALGIDRDDIPAVEVAGINRDHLNEYRITGVKRRLHRTAVHVVSLNDENNKKDTDQKSDRDKLHGVKEHIKSALFLLRLFFVLLLSLNRFLVSLVVFVLVRLVFFVSFLVRLFFVFDRLFFISFFFVFRFGFFVFFRFSICIIRLSFRFYISFCFDFRFCINFSYRLLFCVLGSFRLREVR